MEPTLSFPVLPPETEQEWDYYWRRQMQEIIPRLFLGPYAAANKSQLEALKAAGITHIVCVHQPQEGVFIRANFPDDFKYLVLVIEDSVTENIIHFIPKVKTFIDECFQSQGKVLVHGNSGISRSAALVIAYIMETYGYTYREAFLRVHSKRFCVNPNEGFAQQLVEYELMYKSRLQIEAMPSTSRTGGLTKRKLDEVDPESEQNMDC